MTEAEHNELLAEIVQRELEMYIEATESDESEDIQKHPQTFQFTRLMAHSIHDEPFLRSYLDDLQNAEASGRNFMLERFNPSSGLETQENELAEKIADSEMASLKAASAQYPDIIKGSGSEKFRDFLRTELLSLSPKSLELYAAELDKFRDENRNPAIIRHNWLARKLGRTGLEE